MPQGGGRSWRAHFAFIQVETEENGMEQSVEKIIERNLLEVCVLNPWAGTMASVAFLGPMDRPMTLRG